MRDHRSIACPDSHEAFFVSVQGEMGEEGAHRALLTFDDGRLHFMASAGGRVLVVDPPLSCAAASARRLDYKQTGEEEDLLHPEDDHLVQDCLEVFERESVHHCGFKLVAEAMAASLEVISGFEVIVHAKVSKVGVRAEPAYHLITCAFEPAGVAPSESPRPLDEETDEEKEGMVATVLMHVGLCGASTMVADKIGSLRLFEMHGGSGELSHTKGYRHVYDRLPSFIGGIQMKSQANLPAEMDLRKAYPMCFPSVGGSVVRAQGTCGSCWAFAASTSFLTNVCTAGKGALTLDQVGKRFEVSVQRIISCNPEGFGCHGGHAIAAGSSLGRTLPGKEILVPYKCGGGNSLDHFKSTNTQCDKKPWGGDGNTCAGNVGEGKWHFGGVTVVNGETEMMNAIAEGKSLYVSMGVYQNFMQPFTGIYDRIQGEKMGGHAMVALGYGQTQTRKRYWWIQNSWGPQWGEKGYCKILRGENLADIEKQAMHISGWPEGFEPPNRSVGQKLSTALAGAGIPIDSKAAGAAGIGGLFVLLGLGCSLARCLSDHKGQAQYSQMPQGYGGY